MSGALAGNDAAGLERLAGNPCRPRRSALHAARVERKFECLDQRFDLIARGDDMETRPPSQRYVLQPATGALKIGHYMPIARDKLIIGRAIGTVCARCAPEHHCKREAPVSCASHAVAASSLRAAVDDVVKKRQ